MGAIPCESSAPSCPQHSGKQVPCLACRALGGTLKKGCWDRQGMPSLWPSPRFSPPESPFLSGILLKPTHILFWFHFFFFFGAVAAQAQLTHVQPCAEVTGKRVRLCTNGQGKEPRKGPVQMPQGFSRQHSFL